MSAKPATALPWDGLFNATAFGLGAKVREQNAAYALHAANAYPRLVAELSDAYSDLRDSGKHAAADDIAVLLRELGELND